MHFLRSAWLRGMCFLKVNSGFSVWPFLRVLRGNDVLRVKDGSAKRSLLMRRKERPAVVRCRRPSRRPRRFPPSSGQSIRPPGRARQSSPCSRSASEMPSIDCRTVSVEVLISPIALLAWPAVTTTPATSFWLVCMLSSAAAAPPWNRGDHRADFADRMRGAFSEFSDFVGDHREAGPVLRARGLEARWSASRWVCSASSRMTPVMPPIC